MNDWMMGQVMDGVRTSLAQFERVVAQLKIELQIAEARSYNKLAKEAGLDHVYRVQAEAIKTMIGAAASALAYTEKHSDG